MLVLAAAMWPAQAVAQDLIGPANLEAAIDLRGSVVGGEEGWLDGGFGKLREGGGEEGGTMARVRIASADLAWTPQFTWNLSGHVSATYQANVPDEVDFSEIYLKFRTSPGAVRFGARAGVFWPPISQEHSGVNWGVEDTITPSAANSWVGEEVKVLGLEASVETTLAEHGLSLTGAVFKHDDMAGTLLTYRGWALHDVKVTVGGDFPLPPLSASTAPYQAPITNPFWEEDGRAGFYGRLDWTPPLPVTFNAFYYDNRGDRMSSRAMQTSWRTRFWNLGAMATLGDSTVAKAQAMWGNTLVGPDTPYGIPADVDFATAYLLLTRKVGSDKLAARADWFETDDNSFVEYDNNNEDGWAATLTYQHPLKSYADLLVEVIHVYSDRPARLLNAGIAPEQDQTLLQTSIRVTL
ncbi:hypothetical protein KK137_12140 [Croceibacterium sp. LX-88]|uniref:Porin n=1 Tax=Croceibacterium selenioxidans TaxID=2838833 RepID=A0ABS5W5W3_9SPHN|nr:hypothetical protein [Croceibacterium selenioxidans]MBT2135079.1 hypothetical protein [Croceibacterium selenioxidans]